MADRLTQLQDAIDEYLVQCYAGLTYNYHHHPYADVPDQPSQAPPTASFPDAAPAASLTNGNSAAPNPPADRPQGGEKKDEAPAQPSDKPHSAAEHAAALRELAQGLVLKEQQIEYLIQSLPGIGSGERDQERRIQELQAELKAVERERAEKEVLREELVEGLGKWLVRGKRVP